MGDRSFSHQGFQHFACGVGEAVGHQKKRGKGGYGVVGAVGEHSEPQQSDESRRRCPQANVEDGQHAKTFSLWQGYGLGACLKEAITTVFAVRINHLVFGLALWADFHGGKYSICR